MVNSSDQVSGKEGVVFFRTPDGVEHRAVLLHLTVHSAALEVFDLELDLRRSQIIEPFKVFFGEAPTYEGRATLVDMVSTGTALTCSFALESTGFKGQVLSKYISTDDVLARYQEFLRAWQGAFQVRDEFKVAVSNIETFLVSMRQWLEQLELTLVALPEAERARREAEIVHALEIPALSACDALFERFERSAASLEERERPSHRAYIQLQLLPIVLAAPFAGRCYRKPLGYAGDYEVVNMMFRSPDEGPSLFAKLFNVWLLHQGSAKAHRSRVAILRDKLVQQTARVVREGRRARILNLGCGPAVEIQQFLDHTDLSSQADFHLMDFDQETLNHVSQVLSRKAELNRRGVGLLTIRKSVQQLLKDALRSKAVLEEQPYDLIYCAGLFDYLPDWTCSQLLNLFYTWVRAGGSVLATNVTPRSPNRASLELILDWNLIYREPQEFRRLCPARVPEEAVRLYNDETGYNVFLEFTKPNVS